MKFRRFLLEKILSKTHGGNIRDLVEYYHQFFAKNELEKARDQKDLLNSTLKEVYASVPYYTNLFDSIADKNTDLLQKFTKIPILTKQTIRENFEDLKSTKKDLSFFENTSGGSTGEPVLFLQDKNYQINMWAAKWCFFEFCAAFPDNLVKVWGALDELSKNQKVKGQLIDWLYQRNILNAFDLKNTDIENYLDIIVNSKPTFLEGYVEAIYELALKVEDKNFNGLKGVFTSAGLLQLEKKEIIEKAFGVPVFNRYGSREVGDIACTRSGDSTLLVNGAFNLIELLDDNGNPVKEGEIGGIYITQLHNKIMPLVRYDVGDSGVASKMIDIGGITSVQAFSEIRGRKNTIIETTDARVDSAALTALFFYRTGKEAFKGFGKYQLVQYEKDRFEFQYVVKHRDEWEKEKPIVEARLLKALGQSCKINLKEASTIENLSSGKYEFIRKA